MPDDERGTRGERPITEPNDGIEWSGERDRADAVEATTTDDGEKPTADGAAQADHARRRDHTYRSDHSRRSVLRQGASVVAGGALLTGLTGSASATPHGGEDRPLDVRTTGVEVLGTDSSETTATTKTAGKVDGMDEVDCEECRVGAQVAREGHDRWYGGIHGVVTARVSFRVAVTLVGLRPGRYKCRLVACPITHDHVCFGNSLTIVVKDGHHERKKKEKKKKKHHDEKGDDCPCGYDHPDKHHLTLRGDDWKSVHDYAFEVSADRVKPFTRSCAPDAIDHEFVTANRYDAIHGDVVTGTVCGGGDGFLFAGDVTDLRCDDGVSVYLDGKRFGHH
jgi:hypothetical protein